jgi:hypothetical protein
MRKEGPGGRERLNGNIEAAEQARGRKSIRRHLRDGMEAALRADSEMLAHRKPRTGLGFIVRALVLEAGKGTMAAVKMILQIIDREGEDEEIHSNSNRSLNSLSEGISEGIFEKDAPAASAPGTTAVPAALRSDNRPCGRDARGPRDAAAPAESLENVQSNSLHQGISQGILKKAAREAAEPTAPPNRQQRRRLAQLRSMREKEEARLGQPAMAA